MQVEFDKSFEKSLKKLKHKVVRQRIETLILQLEKAEVLEETSNVKKLQGFDSYYRIKIGDYRIGIERTETGIVRFITVLHRKDIYKRFP